MKDKQVIRHALIMAAGRGNRMKPLTDNLPKAMLSCRGDTLIGHSLSMLSKCVADVHVTVGYRGAVLSQYLMTIGNVSTVFNTEGRGNSWWIHHTLMRYVDEPILVLTCDNITELDIDFLTAEYHVVGCPACMLVPVQPVSGIDGDYIEHDRGLVMSVQRQVPTDLYCSGIQVLNPARVCSIAKESDDFYSIWNQLIANQQLRVSRPYPNTWFSVDTLEQLAKLA